MTRVGVLRTDTRSYEAKTPFHPACAFPELGRAGIQEVDPSNAVYGAVRDLFALLRLDEENFGTQNWNPLGTYIRPGDKVLIKPNFVLHEFGVQKGAHCLTTHGSIIRAVLDYAHLAAGPEGAIVIADAPLQGADFEKIVSQSGMREVQEFYKERVRCDVEVIDLRQLHAVIEEDSSLIRRVERLAGDPKGYCEIDLREASRLSELNSADSKYVVGDYDAAVTNERHRSPRHSYVVSRTVLDADAVLCVPKLKTHSKAGVTVCLKNMVGTIGSKDCLPHHRHGRTNQGGDEFPDDYPGRWLLSARAYAMLQGRVPPSLWRAMRRLAGTLLGAGTPANGDGTQSNFFPSGGWHGNDTIWRTVDDLNRIIFFHDPERRAMQEEPQRRYFAVVDGIIAMEGNGPLRGIPKPTGIILGGEDPVAVDVVAATLMGFEWERIRMLKGIATSHCKPKYSTFTMGETGLRIVSNVKAWDSLKALGREHLNFQAPSGWRDFVEMQHVG
ncbi:MAG: DUF362 domain-containing protein [Candidatus Acidiferrum sp.]